VVAGARTTECLHGIDATAVEVDLAAPDGPARLIKRALDDHGRVDVLVNNVGAVRLRLQGFLGTRDEEFAWAMNINFFAAVRATRAALVAMLNQEGGTIVNVASVNAFFEPGGFAIKAIALDLEARQAIDEAARGTIDYGVAKAALLNFSKSIAQEFGPRGIRVNCVSPGPVATDLWLGEGGVAHTMAKATGIDPETARKKVIASIGGFATGRFTTLEEVATLVVLLASPRTANVTGSNYLIDGGVINPA
jgi:NAD(P)-dependent dehydrogenase (short-subunit alcohol dehydrogenase family)